MLLALGNPNFADSHRKRKDFLDTLAAGNVATSGARTYPEIILITGGVEWMIRVSREYCTCSCLYRAC